MDEHTQSIAGLEALVERLRGGELRRVALVGLAKNTGKTTTLVTLLRALRGAGPAGLISIGVDGEERDRLLGTDKPPVPVAEGDLLVGAERALRRSTAHLEYLDALDVRTPLGELLVARALAPGEVVLAGVHRSAELRCGCALLEAHGAARVWIDGAYGRRAGARGGDCDAVVVSSGAVVADEISSIVERTMDVVTRLDLRAVERSDWRAILSRSVELGRALLVREGHSGVPLSHDSALLGLEGSREQLADPQTRAIAIPGAVTDRVAEELLGVDGGARRTLLVPDGTTLQMDAGLWSRLRQTWSIRALTPAPVAGISVNPTGVQGHRVDAAALCVALARRFEGPVFDPLARPAGLERARS